MGCNQPNFPRKDNPKRDNQSTTVEEESPILKEEDIFQNYLSTEKENSLDNSFIKLKEFEKEELKNLFLSLKKDYANKILKDKYFRLNNIDLSIITNIVKNEESSLIYKKKIVDEISYITEKKEEYKIEQLTILVIGKKRVGKSTLIKYILKLNENEANNTKQNIESEIIQDDNDNFISYKSKNVPYLKLIEFKGIGLDKDLSPEIILKEAVECIKTKISVSRNNNEYNEFINCIWYCVTGARLENAEFNLLKKLREVYDTNDKITKIPIILVYTKTIDEEGAKEIELYAKDNKEFTNVSFVQVRAKNIEIIHTNEILLTKGNEELLSETLKRCTEALQGEMIELMTKAISNNIKEKIKKEIEKIYTDIVEHFKEKFNLEFKEVKYDTKFLDYIVKIFDDNIIKFYNNYIEHISIRSQNLIKSSNIITDIKKFIFLYKEEIKNIIESNIKEKAELLIDKQANIDIEEDFEIRLINKRSLKRFKSTNSLYLKRNLYFISQKFIVHSIINRIWKNFFKSYKNELDKIIDKLIGNNTEEDITKNLKYCFIMKLDDFSKNKNIPLNTRFPQLQEFYKKSENITEEEREFDIKRNNSIDLIDNFDLDLININEEKTPPQYEILQKFDENKLKLLSDETKNSLSNFLQKEMVYQEDSLKGNDNNNDKVFSELKEYERNDLINFFESQKNDFILNKINFPYSLKFLMINNDSITQIIQGEIFEKIYRIKINNEINLINQDIVFSKIDYITILILGKAGVGKSTLVNAMLNLEGEEKAKTGRGGVETKVNKLYHSNKISFLRLYDTRGVEFEQKYSPYAIYNNAKDIIMESMKGENFNDYVQCIWYCFNQDYIDNVEIEIIKKLKTNNPSIPIILIYTIALSVDSYNEIKNKIDQNFPKYPFIKVLAEPLNNFPSFGLNELLKVTLENCKVELNNKIYQNIREKSYKKVMEKLSKEHELINKKIINEITNSFINNYKKVFNENELLNYIYELLEMNFFAYMKVQDRLIKDNFSQNDLRKISDLDTFIKNFVDHYTNKTNETIKPFLDECAIKFLDMQLSFEKKHKQYINKKNKMNKDKFLKTIKSFLNDNFYYISQKYIIYRMLYYFENISLKIKESTDALVKKLLNQRKPEDLLEKVHKQKFIDLENRIEKIKRDNRLYEEKKYVKNLNRNVYDAAPAPV